MKIRTKRGALRKYNAIIAQCRRDMAGGLQFGMDMPTLRAWFPDRYAMLQAIREAYPKLPE